MIAFLTYLVAVLTIAFGIVLTLLMVAWFAEMADWEDRPTVWPLVPIFYGAASGALTIWLLGSLPS